MINRFGSSSDMVIQAVEENGLTLFLAIDEKGLYLTTARYLDRNLADPHRHAGTRAAITGRLTALGLDARALLEANRHRVNKIGEGEPKKKINPLKASRRGLKS